MGRLAIAIPVWLASQGEAAGDIGSYIGVGKLMDLANLTISDFFRGFATPERK